MNRQTKFTVAAGQPAALLAAGMLTAALLGALPAAADTIALRGAKVYTVGAAGTLDNATVVMRDGRITAVGRDVAIPKDAKVIDVTGQTVTPGLIDAYGRLGITEIDGEAATVDDSANNLPYSAAFTVEDAIEPRSMRIQVNRAEGITAGLVAPEAGRRADGLSAIIGGQASFLRLKPGFAIDVKTPVGFVFTYGEAGADGSGGARSAALLRLRELLADARDYATHREAYANGARREYAGTRLDLEALQPLLAGEVPLLVEVQRASDILVMLKLAREQKLKLVVIGGAEAWEVAPQLASAKVPVVLDVFDNLPGSFEALGATLENATRLQKAGVEIAFAYAEHYNPRNARQLAGNAVAHGLPFEAALAAITRNPARIYGQGAALGSIEVGKVADVVVWDGDPLETTSMTTHVFVGGEAVPTVTRQTLLRDRYRKPRGDLPPAYVHPGAGDK